MMQALSKWWSKQWHGQRCLLCQRKMEQYKDYTNVYQCYCGTPWLQYECSKFVEARYLWDREGKLVAHLDKHWPGETWAVCVGTTHRVTLTVPELDIRDDEAIWEWVGLSGWMG